MKIQTANPSICRGRSRNRSARWSRTICGTATSLIITFISNGAFAQQAIDPLLDPVVLPDYSRDRNVSVKEEPRPNYQALGVDIANFQVFPSLTATTKTNSNVYFDDFYKKSDIVEQIQPALYAQSNWSSNLLQIYATDQIQRNAKYSVFDRNTWSVYLLGRIDVTDDFSVTAAAERGFYMESPYSSVAGGATAALSEVGQFQSNLKAMWTGGRIRLTLGYDHSAYSFDPLQLTTGGYNAQAYRDNHDDREFIRGEYSLSPSLSVYAQIVNDAAKYNNTAEFGLPGRNSTGTQFISGFSLDLSGFARGAIGAGYTRRTYDSGAFVNPSGFSIQGKIELFPSPDTTITAIGYRLIRDVNVGQSVAFYDSRFQLNIDHAIRSNVILTAELAYDKQDFLESTVRRRFYQFNFLADVQLNRRFSVNAGLSYATEKTDDYVSDAPYGQAIASLGLKYRI